MKNILSNQSIYLCTQNYEARIDALQRQVEEQSVTMSMYSSYTPDDFHNDEDIFGKNINLNVYLWKDFDQFGEKITVFLFSIGTYERNI